MDLIYKTKDRYITAGAVSDSEWAGMCRALNREDLLDDERFNTSAARVSNAELRKKITGEEIEKWDSAELLERLQEENVPSAPLLDRMELMEHDQIIANDAIERIVHDGFGEVRQARPAARFEATPSGIQGTAPQLGEHGAEVLAEIGYDQREIEALIESKVLAIPKP